MTENTIQPETPIEIAGAGPAGLAAAITLARAGRNVTVFEMQKEVGHRFGGDFQGLENWSTTEDVLTTLAASGLTTDFDAMPCRNGSIFDFVNSGDSLLNLNSGDSFEFRGQFT
jgi:2-polyprenyl-6-methoxyphenol hydroxylase-like FAD-dependent oxidoreductase